MGYTFCNELKIKIEPAFVQFFICQTFSLRQSETFWWIQDAENSDLYVEFLFRNTIYTIYHSYNNL